MIPHVTLFYVEGNEPAPFYQVTQNGQDWAITQVRQKEPGQKIAIISGYINALRDRESDDTVTANEFFRPLSEKISKIRSEGCFFGHAFYTLLDRMPQSVFTEPDFFEKSLRHRIYLFPQDKDTEGAEWTNDKLRIKAIQYLWKDFLAIFAEGLTYFRELDVKKIAYHPLLRIISMVRDVAAIFYPKALFTIISNL